MFGCAPLGCDLLDMFWIRFLDTFGYGVLDTFGYVWICFLDTVKIMDTIFRYAHIGCWIRAEMLLDTFFTVLDTFNVLYRLLFYSLRLYDI